jgi:homoserine kinase
MVRSVTVRAPCSTANVGAGFDIFGLALDAFYDEVTVTKRPKEFGIKIVTDDKIPKKLKLNTAGIVAEQMMSIDQGSFCPAPNKKYGVEIKIKKDVPAGYGLGSSAASAAACAIGINELFEMKFDKEKLTFFAGHGEEASAGVAHYDNVAAAVFGNFVVVFSNPSDEKIGQVGCRRLTPPSDLRLIIAVPKMKTKNQKTKLSRKAIPKEVKFSDAHTNKLNIIAMLLGILDKNAMIFGRGAEDVIVEQARKKMIPGFDKIKNGARKAGANNVTISGAGPSVIAFTTSGESGRRKDIEEAMRDGFKSAKLDCEIIYCKVSSGPKII